MSPGGHQVVVDLVTKVFDQGILQYVEKSIRGDSPIVLLRVQPAGRDIGVLRQHHAVAGNHFCSRVGAARTAPRAWSLPVPPSSVHCVSVVFSIVSAIAKARLMPRYFLSWMSSQG
jgi:hypothetical protein